MSILVPKLADLGFVKETLIFKNWSLKILIGYKYRPLQGELSNVLIFCKQWREAPRTGSPSLPISSAEMPDTSSTESMKLVLLYV